MILFNGKLNKSHEGTGEVRIFPTPLTKKIVGDWEIFVTAVDEKKGDIKIALTNTATSEQKKMTVNLAKWENYSLEDIESADEAAEKPKPAIKKVPPKSMPKPQPLQKPETSIQPNKTSAKNPRPGSELKKTVQSTNEKKVDSYKELQRYVVQGNPDLVIQKGREFETVDKELKKATLKVETIKRFSNREIYVDLTVVDESGTTESMSVTPEELATILKKSRENQKNLSRNSRAKTPSLNTTPRKKDTTSDTLPLGLRKKQKIEVYDEVYTVAGYDTATKKFSLISDSGKRELVDYDNMEFALAPKESVGSLSPEEKLDAAKLKAKTFLEEARTWIDAGDIDSLVGVITRINDTIVTLLAKNASDAEVEILKEAKTSLEHERDTLLHKQTENSVDKKIHIAEASIGMLKEAITKDETLLAQLRAELDEKLAAEKNIAGKKIFDDIVASVTTEVLATGIEGDNYYYDAKDGRGYTIRHYYRFDGTFDGNKTIAEPDNTLSHQQDVEATLALFPEYVQSKAAQLVASGYQLISVEDTGSEYALSYSDKAGETEIEFIEKNKESEYIPTHHIEYYLSVPNKDGSFNLSSARKNIVDGASIWQFEVLGNNLFAVSLPKSEAARKMAMSFVDKTVDPLFDTTGLAMNKKIIDLKVIRPAIVELVGDRFVLKDKGDLNYIQ